MGLKELATRTFAQPIDGQPQDWPFLSYREKVSLLNLAGRAASDDIDGDLVAYINSGPLAKVDVLAFIVRKADPTLDLDASELAAERIDGAFDIILRACNLKRVKLPEAEDVQDPLPPPAGTTTP